MFKYLYYLIALIIYLLFIPYLLIKLRNKKYAEAIPAKFFLQNNPKFRPNKVWFHSCSMGETKSLQPLIEQFDKDDINLSVITNTGFEQAVKMGIKNIRYLPYEIFLPFWITKQKVLVVTEAELWYMLFFVAKANDTKTILINARISDRSYKSYLRFRFFYKQIFKNIDKVFAQTTVDKERLECLGAKNVVVSGNIKLATLPQVTKQFLKPNEPIITAASTHDGEEEIVLHAWNKSMGKLIIVPRHPERFGQVDSLIEKFILEQDLTYHKFSQNETFDSDIILVDKMGELNNIYNISDVVILGGSFIQTAGGHNPIEPAFFKTKLISGEVIFNQKSLFECVDNYYIVKPEDLAIMLNNISDLNKSALNAIGTIEPIVEEIKGR